MKTIYITEPSLIDPQKVKSALSEDYEVLPGDASFSGNIPEDCTALIIRSATTITPSIKEHFPHLTDIMRVGVGVDNIDMDFCNKEHIAVYNAPGANADAVSEYIVCMMLVALRRVHALTQEDVVSWNRFKFVGHSMSGRTIGIIGFGHIGRLIHQKLQGFGCKEFFAYDPFLKKEDFPEGVTQLSTVEGVLEKSDLITLHVPLIPQTHHLINKENIDLLHDHAILLNASRGGIVDEVAAVEAAHTRGLIYIADTVEGEPKVSQSLLDEENVIVTPHIAALTQEAEDNVITVAIENFLNNRPINP
jgi:phosphoglycerate dehydrogenase-like enzyme